jgi:hypothetical protein
MLGNDHAICELQHPVLLLIRHARGRPGASGSAESSPSILPGTGCASHAESGKIRSRRIV